MLRDVEKQNMKYHLQPEIADVYLVPSFLRPFSSIFLPKKRGVGSNPDLYMVRVEDEPKMSHAN